MVEVYLSLRRFSAFFFSTGWGDGKIPRELFSADIESPDGQFFGIVSREEVRRRRRETKKTEKEKEKWNEGIRGCPTPVAEVAYG